MREALEVQAAKLFADVATSRERAELRKLAKRVDALGLSQADRIPHVIAHQELHRRIAECTRCPALSTTIEQTNALASIWFCVARQPSPDDPKRRHQDLMDVLSAGNPDLAASAMREHIACGLQHTMEVLEPYFSFERPAGQPSSEASRSNGKSSNPQVNPQILRFTIRYRGSPGRADPASHALPSAYSFSTAGPRRPGRSPFTAKPFFDWR